MIELIEIKKFTVSKVTAMKLLDSWFDEQETVEIRILPHREDEFIIHLTRHIGDISELS